MMRTLKVSLVLAGWLFSGRAIAQDNQPPAAPAGGTEAAPPAENAAPAAAPAEEKKKKTGGPSLSLSPEAPQVGGLVVPEAVNVSEEATSSEWKFEVTGYFRAPMRMSWGPATTAPPNGGNPGTQLRTPPLIPDGNYIDWRYTNSFVAPWTELNFHYGNDRVKAEVQIASYNLTDPGYRRLEANLGINQAFLIMKYPELWNEDAHLTLTAGGFTNRYGAAGRYDAGKYETYLFGRTHVAGLTATLEQDVNDLTFSLETGGGAKLEPIPFYGPPGGNDMNNPNEHLPAWEPYPGPVAQESAFVAHVHGGLAIKKSVLVGLHYIRVFANDNERSSSYMNGNGMPFGARPVTGPGSDKPIIWTGGFDVKWLTDLFGDGYVGLGYLSATNAQYLGDAIEVLHSFGGWQLHDNYFGAKGAPNDTTGNIITFMGQEVYSLGKLFHYPQAFWGDGPDLILSLFWMFNHVNAPSNTAFSINKLKYGGEVTYVPISWLGIGGRADIVQPNLSNSNQSFMVFSPRVILRTAFVTHEQLLFQYSRYSYGSQAKDSMFPYSTQPGAAGLGADSNAFQVAAIIWF
jgi:hypothetical protein